MKIKRARQILKSFADDTRLRIINLLSKKELTVTEICEVLNTKQSITSKHLARLRLTGVVSDKRKGLNVFYCLAKSGDKAQNRFKSAVVAGIQNIDNFTDDLEKLENTKSKSSKKKGGKR